MNPTGFSGVTSRFARSSLKPFRDVTANVPKPCKGALTSWFPTPCAGRLRFASPPSENRIDPEAQNGRRWRTSRVLYVQNRLRQFCTSTGPPVIRLRLLTGEPARHAQGYAPRPPGGLPPNPHPRREAGGHSPLSWTTCNAPPLTGSKSVPHGFSRTGVERGSRARPEAARGAQPQASTERVRTWAKPNP